MIFKMYTDDTQFYLLLSDVENTEDNLSKVMDNGKWMNSKELRLNKVKTKYLTVGKNKDLRRLDSL